MARIPATIVTGFLGAGKTSLIRHLLANADGRRLALVINEFGDLGVDRELVAGCGDPLCRPEDIIELTNGCICCAVADDFLPAIEALLAADPPPDHIVIETSGLALPKPLVKAFDWPEARARVTVDGVVAVVDAEALAAGRFEEMAGESHENPLEEVFEEQIQCADLVLVNKIDCVDSPALDQALGVLAPMLRPGVKILTASQGAFAPQALLGLGAAAEDDLASRPSHHEQEGDDHDHDDFDSFVVELAAVADPAALEQRVRQAALTHDVLRIKGFVDVAGKPMRLAVQAVGPRVQRYFDRPWRAGEERRSALVAIGVKGMDRDGVMSILQGQEG